MINGQDSLGLNMFKLTTMQIMVFVYNEYYKLIISRKSTKT